MVAALALRAVLPALAQDKQHPDRQVIADAITAANWQLRLDDARVLRRQYPNGNYTEQAFRNQEKETKELIDRLRSRWSSTPYAATFNNDFKRALKDDNYRALALRRDYVDPGGSPAGSSSGQSIDDMVGNMVLFILGGASVLLFIAWAIARYSSRRKAAPVAEQPSDTYGSASFAMPRPYMPDELHVLNGIFFGKSSEPGPPHLAPFGQHQGGPVCSLPENHSLIVARTRTGKFTRICAPTLLRGYIGSSAIVIDPKGEAAAVTARTRQHPFAGFDLKSKVHIVNPWGVLAPVYQQLGFTPATYNPLDLLDRNDPNAVAIAQAIASAICPSARTGKESFWSDSAASLLTAVLLWLTDQEGITHDGAAPEIKTLGRAREIVSLPRTVFKEKYLTKMIASSAFEGAIRESAGPFIDMADVTYSGVISNLSQHTKFLSDPQVKRATAVSSFSMRELMTGTTTIYVVIPPDRIDTQRTWLRLLITAGMQTYKNRPPGPVNRCLFLIDEFPALGRLDELPRDIATMAGYGVDFCLIVQGIDQLKAVYGDDAATIMSNCAYKWFSNVNDLPSAEYLSKTLGNKTVDTTSKSSSFSMGKGGGSTSESESQGQTGRPLLMPDEVLNLGRDTAILLAPGSKPHYLRPVDYWQLPEAFAHMRQYYPRLYWEPPLSYDPNPYHQSEKLPA